jgi:hypothetical protein
MQCSMWQIALSYVTEWTVLRSKVQYSAHFSSPLDEQDRGFSCRVSCLTLHLISLWDWRLHDTLQHGTLSLLKRPSSQTWLAWKLLHWIGPMVWTLSAICFIILNLYLILLSKFQALKNPNNSHYQPRCQSDHVWFILFNGYRFHITGFWSHWWIFSKLGPSPPSWKPV